MNTEIQKCMVDRTEGTATFYFPETFIGFSGHFPEQPVLPGVCIIQAALVAAETSLKLETIRSAKFFNVVLPNQKLDLKWVLIDGELIASATSDGERIAQVKLEVRHA